MGHKALFYSSRKPYCQPGEYPGEQSRKEQNWSKPALQSQQEEKESKTGSKVKNWAGDETPSHLKNTIPHSKTKGAKQRSLTEGRREIATEFPRFRNSQHSPNSQAVERHCRTCPIWSLSCSNRGPGRAFVRASASWSSVLQYSIDNSLLAKTSRM